MTKMRN